MPKRLQLSSKTFLVLYLEVRDKIKERIEQTGKKDLSDNAIWNWKNDQGENLFISMLIEEKLLSSGQKFSTNYLPKLFSKAKKKASITLGGDPYISIFFKFCGTKDLESFMRNMKLKGKITSSHEEEQRYMNEGIYIPPSDTYAIERLLEAHYKDTQWWLYFYGNTPTQRKNNKPYSLVRLILKVFGRNPKDRNKYDIYIQNTTHHPEHIDFKGYIDLEYCSESIMVCNLKTIRDTKQLHIKFHIDKTGQNLYLGQYLNFGDYNEIISGSVILQKIPLKELEYAKPSTFRFNKKEIQMVPESIIRYFRNPELNFRKTPTGIFSERKLKSWKDRYDKTRNNSGPQGDFGFLD